MKNLENGDFLGSEDPTFFSHLGSLGIRGIELEKNRIRSERESLSAGTRNLAFENYQTFISAAECGKDVAKHLDQARSHSEKCMTEKLPPLRQACLEFEMKAQELSARRKSTSLVLARHTRLLEVLELPQLAETCVRNGHYEEALELKQYVTRLNKKLGNIPIVAEVVQSVQVACNAMLNQLLGQLRAPISLPACLKVVGYLRRMDAFKETELRLRFLQARDAWLTGVLRTVPNDNPYDHLTRSMELTRVHLFDIVTQYRALFSDDDPLIGSAPASNRILFSSWMDRKIQDFLILLKTDLDRGAKNQSLDAIIGQAMYFGQSFGRIGADFRLSLAPIFTESLRHLAMTQLAGVEENFRNGMYNLALKANVSKVREDQTLNVADPHQPPASLLDYYPLAELCNSILSGLNELRLMTPTSLAPEIFNRIQVILEYAATVLNDRESQISKSTSTSMTEKTAFERCVIVFNNDLLPYLEHCLTTVFPPSNASNSSVSKTSLKLDAIRCLLPFQHLIAAKLTVATTENVDTGQTQSLVYVVDRAEMLEKEIQESVQDADQSEADKNEDNIPPS